MIEMVLPHWIATDNPARYHHHHVYAYVYRICSNKSQAQIEAGARIKAGCQLCVSLIEAGFEYTPGNSAI